jgi:hypothetical protein
MGETSGKRRYRLYEAAAAAVEATRARLAADEVRTKS